LPLASPYANSCFSAILALRLLGGERGGGVKGPGNPGRKGFEPENVFFLDHFQPSVTSNL